MAKPKSLVTINHGGQCLEVLCKEDDTIEVMLNRCNVPLEGAVTKNGAVAEASDPVKDGDEVSVSPKSGVQG